MKKKHTGIAQENGLISVEENTCATSIPGVFAGGDAVKVSNIITAISMGKRAAVSMDKYVRGTKATLEYTKDTVCVDPDSVLRRAGYFKDEETGIDTQTRSACERKYDFNTYTRPMTEQEARRSLRCLTAAAARAPAAKPFCDFAPFISEPDTLSINKDECVACGMCFNRCPNKNIEMVCTGEKV